MTRYSVFQAKLGWMGVVKGEKGIRKIILPYPRSQEVEKRIASQFPGSLRDDEALQPLANMLTAYYRGNALPQDIHLDWSQGTDFSKTVWQAARSIPWGEVRTYQWLSLLVKKPRACRAVGGALGRNPFPIVVPCHRVVRTDGTLGGFSAPTGIRLKRKMLELEGVRFNRQGGVIWKKETEEQAL